ncbi:MAG: sigma-70 family RNA polymerase sigma factor [Candidatus Limnocylindrales bacterium]
MDTELVIRARSGDHGAFADIVALVARRFHGIACAVLRDAGLAEDAAQAAMVAIWRDLPRLRDPERFEAWANRILLNACFAEGRRARWRGRELTVAPPRDTTAPEELHTVIDRDQLERGFARLPMDQRAVLVTHYFMDLPSDEAAQTLGIPVGTYKSRLHRAIEAMRALLEADDRAPLGRTMEVAR